MQEKTIKIKRTARYHSNYDTSLIYSNITYCLHGYGQLAKYFARKFQDLNDNTLIIAPEAFQRFYLEGYNQRVGASWMTKEDRENDIEDYIAYLDQLHTTVIKETKQSIKEINAIGFSQGVSTLLRWANTNSVTFKNIYLFSGTTPEELNTQCNSVAFDKTQLHYLYDKDDKLLPHTKTEASEHFFTNNKLNHLITHHNNGHQIPITYLMERYNQ